MKIKLFKGLLFLFLPCVLSAIQANNERPVPVYTELAKQRELTSLIWVPGKVMVTEKVEISADVSGRLSWVPEPGFSVVKGDTVAQLDKQSLVLGLSELEANREKEQALLKYAEIEKVRLEDLAQHELAAKSELDNVLADLAVAKANLKSNGARINILKDKIAKTRLIATFNGMVTQRYLHQGEWAEQGKQIIRIENLAQQEIRIVIPVYALQYLAMNQTLKIKMNEVIMRFPVHAILPMNRGQTPLYDIRLQINPQTCLHQIKQCQMLKAGSQLKVAIPLSQTKKTITVSRDALVLRRNGIFIFKINDADVAQRFTVKTGIAQGRYIEISGDINEDDKIVTKGNERLRPGQKVTIIKK